MTTDPKIEWYCSIRISTIVVNTRSKL